MAESIYITYEGMTKSIAGWARYFGTSSMNIARWYHAYGMDVAVMLLGMDHAERRLWRKQQEQPNLSAGWFKDLPEVDEYEEEKNRLDGYLNQRGWTEEEIRIKARMI